VDVRYQGKRRKKVFCFSLFNLLPFPFYNILLMRKKHFCVTLGKNYVHPMKKFSCGKRQKNLFLTFLWSFMEQKIRKKRRSFGSEVKKYQAF